MSALLSPLFRQFFSPSFSSEEDRQRSDGATSLEKPVDALTRNNAARPTSNAAAVIAQVLGRLRTAASRAR